MEMSHTQEEEEEDEGDSDSLADPASHFSPALPGLPDELATMCIARVPSISQIWAVCKAWRQILQSSPLFHSVRQETGLARPQWLYALLKSAPSSSTSFQWHAYDPLARTWHHLPPLPIPIAFHLSSPSFIGHTYSVQCAASATHLFMVAACRLGDEMQLEDSQENDVVGLQGQFARLDGQRHPCLLGRPRAPLSPALPSLLIFNTISRSWSFSSPFLYGPRCWCATGVDTHGRLYVTSGCGKLWDIEVSKCAEVYDPEHDTWMPIEGLGSSKFSGEAITAVNYEGKLHMVSGRGVFNKVGVMYDAALSRWVDMPHGMKAGWKGTCIVVDGMLLDVDESLGQIRLYQSAVDRWRMLVEHPMLKSLRQVIAAPGSRICGVMKEAHGSYDSSQSSQQDVVRIVHLSPSPADSAVNSLVGCELNFIDIAPPAPNVTIVSLQLLSSILTSSPISS